ncbi:MAG: F0F1 ATP synthase subunit delta [Patescibacteria group bacterium]
MNKVSRRSLARYAADRLLAGDFAPEVAKAVASVLVEDKRLNEAELLLADINFELESRGKVATALITAANDLGDKLRIEIKSLVKKASKVDRVILNEQIDKSVIGGLRIETATRIWDKTVARQLNELRKVF